MIRKNVSKNLNKIEIIHRDCLMEFRELEDAHLVWFG